MQPSHKLQPVTVYLGLGANLGTPLLTIQSALESIRNLRGVQNLKVSSFYKTKPVSDIPQPYFVNAVCSFETYMDPHFLFSRLEYIESLHGKVPKPKNAPRLIDIDLLFYGNLFIRTTKLEVPHPRWDQRLFVIVPLTDLISNISFWNPELQVYENPNFFYMIKQFSVFEQSEVRVMRVGACMFNQYLERANSSEKGSRGSSLDRGSRGGSSNGSSPIAGSPVDRESFLGQTVFSTIGSNNNNEDETV